MAKLATGILKLFGKSSTKSVDDVAPAVTAVVTKKVDNLPVVSNRVVSAPSVSPIATVVAKAEPASIPIVYGKSSFSLVDDVLDAPSKSPGSVLSSLSAKLDNVLDSVKSISTGTKVKIAAVAGLGTAGLAYSSGLIGGGNEEETDSIIPESGEAGGNPYIHYIEGGTPYPENAGGNPGNNDLIGGLQTQIDGITEFLNALVDSLFGTGEDGTGGIIGGGGLIGGDGTVTGTTKRKTLIAVLIAVGAIIAFVIIKKKKGKKGAKK